MAYAVTAYYCETCGEEYNDINSAIKCEKRHLHPKEIARPVFKRGDKAPESIVITCINDDGKKQNISYYKRREEAGYQWP